MQLATSFTKELPAKLTEEEVDARASQLARLVEEIADVEQEKSKIARQFAEKLKGLNLRKLELAHAVSSGEESRPVLCSERADTRRFTIETYRHDTSEIVESRAMNADEVEEARQMGLFGNVRVAADAPAKGSLDVEAPKPEAAADAPAASTTTTPKARGGLRLVSHGFGDDQRPPFGGEEPAASAAEEPAAERTVDPEPPPADPAADIADPAAVLDGTAAKPAKKPRVRRRRGGKDVPEPNAETPAATPGDEGDEPDNDGVYGEPDEPEDERGDDPALEDDDEPTDLEDRLDRALEAADREDTEGADDGG